MIPLPISNTRFFYLFFDTSISIKENDKHKLELSNFLFSIIRPNSNRSEKHENASKTHSHFPSARQLYRQILAEELIRSQPVDGRVVVVVFHQNDPLLESVYDSPAALRSVCGANPAAFVVPLALQGEGEVTVHYQLAALLGQGVFDLT